MSALLRPAVYAALPKIQPPRPPEPNWMIEYGWIELTSPARPGWRAIHETWWDACDEIYRGPQTAVYRAVEHGPAEDDRCPVLQRITLIVDPESCEVIELTEE